jgi:hypothetical protein
MTDHTTDDATRTTPASRREVLQGTAGVLAAAALGGVAGTAGASDHRDERSFQVRVENVSAGAALPTPLSPGAYAVHRTPKPMFTGFESASEGLERLAEDGMPGDLVAELDGTAGVTAAGAFGPEQTVADPNDPTGEVPGAPPVFPGGAFEFEVAASPGASLSLATMFVQSNDLFLSPDVTGIDLFAEGEAVAGDVTDEIALWEAGTEVDQTPGEGPDQAPRQSAVGAGESEDSYVVPAAIAQVGGDYPAADDVLSVTLTPQ